MLYSLRKIQKESQGRVVGGEGGHQNFMDVAKLFKKRS